MSDTKHDPSADPLTPRMRLLVNQAAARVIAQTNGSGPSTSSAHERAMIRKALRRTADGRTGA